ncbi:MAG: 1-(5-phosphoribosyl)-5-[(5-phosphoribosylamino)methylideneamino]imidazole-4-carboxamide isomerase [Armatimonadetes bacterium]|nr:1-(5-phosphoribosyl)-5-[(5-phosphoribosylamino)methylideneamino]imidazole-4-carboxamide isomerase [Armatimonadota bacterium]MDW8120873.1 1-(5-phosphoribosyl)-5-[(5-phosphoribosylamino)methylideneamino]imidazole-4-carboxamide isomerase [Armatimonadota bacterium]
MDQTDFVVIPAIDLLRGQVVRLRQGRYDQVTVYSDDPVAVAVSFEQQGARWIHIVDLDGARQGRPVHTQVIARICSQVSCRLQVGGGLRDLQALELVFAAGVARCILGTGALTNNTLVQEALRRFGSDKVAVALDVRDKRLALEGWVGQSDWTPDAVARRLTAEGVTLFLYTDILRDGTLTAPNFQGLEELARSVDGSFICAGGVSTTDHIARLARMKSFGVVGCIVGRALYEGHLSLTEALAAAESEPSCY